MARPSDQIGSAPYGAAQGQYLKPFQRKFLIKSLQAELRPEYRRRIEIMLLADIGQSQTQICAELGCSQETARYWIAMLQTGQFDTWNDRPIGRPKTVNDQYLDRLRELANRSPREYGYPFQSWTAQWLSKHLAKEFFIEVSDRHINRLLKKMGISIQQRRHLATSPRPAKPKDPSIVISNLPSCSPPESSELWLFKSIY